jgi:formiminotetrahydrofolate cyclodeaminase
VTESTPPQGTALVGDERIAAYLDALASSAPAPGGGSATALVGAMGVALVSMVANFTVGRERFAAVELQMRALLDETVALRDQLEQLMDEDERAYTALSAAYRLPRGSDEEKRARSRAIQRGLLAAAEPPLAMARICRRTLELAEVVAGAGNANLASDAGVAALLAEAALRAGAINVRVNLARVRNQEAVQRIEGELNALLEGTPSLKEEVLAVAGRRMVGGE